MAEKEFTSIRHKLIVKITQILLIAFFVVLSAVTLFSIRSTNENLMAAESRIRASIVAKGNILVTNNSLALAGMVADNAFTAVNDLVSSTVSNDEDIVYGIYMDDSLRPWVAARADAESTELDPTKSFEDPTSLWANNVSVTSHKLIGKDALQVYEFAAPVFVDDERSGTIRYGISTKTMHNALHNVQEQSRNTMFQTIATLLVITLIVFLTVYVVIKRLAVFITRPIGELTTTANIIADGDYSNTISIESNDEIGILANNFDRMRNIVKRKINDLKEINTVGENLALQHKRINAIENAFEAFSARINVVAGAMYAINMNGALAVEYAYPDKDDIHPVLDPNNNLINNFLDATDIAVTPNTALDEKVGDIDVSQLPPTSVLAIPLFDEDKLVGASLLLCDSKKLEFSSGEYEYFRAIGRALSISIKNIHMRDVIQEQNQNLEKKVQERTKSLREKTNDIVNMMKHLHQGLFTVAAGGIIQPEYSQYLTTIFATSNIADKPFSTLLFNTASLSSDAVESIEETVSSIIQSDELTYEMNKHLLIKNYEMVDENAELRFIELDWNPIFQSDVVEKIMVTVRDVTELRKLEEDTANKQRELLAISSLLQIDKIRFFQFIHSTKSCVRKAFKVFESSKAITIDEWRNLMRDMHTVKGNARTFAFNEIAENVHHMETLISPLNESQVSIESRDEIFRCLDQLGQSIGFYEDIAVYKLEWRETEDLNASLTVDREQLNSGIVALRSAAQTSPSAKAVVGNALNIFRRLAFTPLDEMLKPIIESMASIAEQLDKDTPQVKLSVDNIYINNTSVETIAIVFTHILRNAVDHGIESREDRLAAGKPATGTIRITARQQGEDMLLSVCDDGQGLNLRGIAQQYFDVKHNNISDQEIADSIFKPGVSTVKKITEISGRGIGMDAVKYSLQQQGADISINLDKQDQADGRRSFSLDIALPEAMYSC